MSRFTRQWTETELADIVLRHVAGECREDNSVCSVEFDDAVGNAAMTSFDTDDTSDIERVAELLHDEGVGDLEPLRAALARAKRGQRLVFPFEEPEPDGTHPYGEQVKREPVE